MTSRQTTALINFGLLLLVAGLAWLIIMTFTNWRLSMPETPKVQGSPLLVKQLREVLGEQKYQTFSTDFTEIAGQPPEYNTIRQDSYADNPDTIKFLADSAAGPSTYSVTINKQSAETDLSCPIPTELQDSNWVCPLSDTGDHLHGEPQ